MTASILLLIVIGAVAIAAFAHRRGIQPGAITVVVGAAASFIPALPRLEFDPDLILGIVMPPLLYSAAQRFSFFRFVRELRPIFALGVGLVLVTTFAIGGLAVLLLPTLPLAAAFVLAAVVAPPDSVTTVSHGREYGLPKRVVGVLTGESLVNDAAALTIFGVAVAAVTGDQTFISSPVWLFVYSVGVGIVVGVVLGGITIAIRRAVANATIESTIGLLVPFGAYLLAQTLHASGVLAVVVAGFSVSLNTAYDARRGRSIVGHRTRLQEEALWPVIDTLLEALVFAYMGLQLRWILQDVAGSDLGLWHTLGVAALILLAVIVLRFAWVFAVFGWPRYVADWIARHPDGGLARRRAAREHQREAMYRARAQAFNQRSQATGSRQRARTYEPRRPPMQWRELVLVAWAGMRGIVTLAAAAAVPTLAAGAPFPGRGAIQAVAFVVAVGTVLIQAPTTPVLARALKFDLAQEEAAEKADRDAALAVIRDIPETDYEQRREAIAYAATSGLDDEAAREVTRQIDLEQTLAEAKRGESGDDTEDDTAQERGGES